MSFTTANALAIVSLAAMTACTTAPVRPAATPIVENYQPNEIIVPGRVTGVLASIDGCVRLRAERGRIYAAQFPPGTTYSAADGAMAMPSGERLPFGKRLTLVVEAPPTARTKVPECRGLPPLQILHRKASR